MQNKSELDTLKAKIKSLEDCLKLLNNKSYIATPKDTIYLGLASCELLDDNNNLSEHDEITFSVTNEWVNQLSFIKVKTEDICPFSVYLQFSVLGEASLLYEEATNSYVRIPLPSIIHLSDPLLSTVNAKREELKFRREAEKVKLEKNREEKYGYTIEGNQEIKKVLRYEIDFSNIIKGIDLYRVCPNVYLKFDDGDCCFWNLEDMITVFRKVYNKPDLKVVDFVKKWYQPLVRSRDYEYIELGNLGDIVRSRDTKWHTFPENEYQLQKHLLEIFDYALERIEVWDDYDLLMSDILNYNMLFKELQQYTIDHDLTKLHTWRWSPAISCIVVRYIPGKMNEQYDMAWHEAVSIAAKAGDKYASEIEKS